jgi:hypothetical protein
VVTLCTAVVTGAVAAWTVEVTFGMRSAEAVAGAATDATARAARAARVRVVRRGRADRWSGGRIPNRLPPTGNG